MLKSLRVLVSRWSMFVPVLLLGAGGLFLGGCAGGTSIDTQIDTRQVQPLDEVAVVSVRTAKRYRNEIEKGPADTVGVREAVRAVTEMSERQARRADPRYRAAAVQVRDYLFETFWTTAPFDLLAEQPVLQSTIYQAFGDDGRANSDWQASLFATPDGYRALAPAHLTDTRDPQSLLDSLPSRPDGLLFAETRFSLVRDRVHPADQNRSTRERAPEEGAILIEGDTVQVDVEATVQIHVLDRSGSTALTVEQTAQSVEDFSFVYGQGWDVRQIKTPAQQATRAALEKVTTRIRNKLPGEALATARQEAQMPEKEHPKE